MTYFFCKGFAKSCAKMITFNDFPSHWPSMRLTDTITYFYFKLCSTFFTSKSWSIHIVKFTVNQLMAYFFCKGFAKSCAKMITFNDFPSHWPSMRLTDTITYFYFKLCSTFFTTKSWSIHIFKLTLTHFLHFSAMKKSHF